MAGKNIHKEPFDEATLAKLEIFEQYTQEWLPVFVSTGIFPTICIFDLFAGTGHDTDGVPGSPIRILNVIKRFASLISTKRVTVKLFLNEFEPPKYALLKASVEKYLLDNPNVAQVTDCKISQNDFNEIYIQVLPYIQTYPSLVFLDQNGVKFTTPSTLLALEKTKQTDFLFFISSSFVLRFGKGKEFSNYLTIDVEALKKNPYKYIHVDVVKAIANQFPSKTQLKLHPFSLKKGTNIYGLVFGAKNPKAVEKFLSVVWAKNPVHGEANFDINEDVTKPSYQFDMFAPPKKTKREKFQELLEQTLQQHRSVTNRFVYLFTLEQGHPIKHATEHIKVLKKNGKVNYNSLGLKLNYQDAYKGKNLVEISWIGK